MIENIKEKNMENMALMTMILDEVQGIYALKTENRAYEVERLESTIVTSLYMINERVQDITELIDKAFEAELSEKKEGDK